MLAGFTELTTQFKRDNRQEWEDINNTYWPYESLYPIDGYTLIVQLELQDTYGVQVCVQMGTDTDNDDFICFGIKYREDADREVPNIVEQFTSRIEASVNYIGDDAASQSPTYL